MSDTIKVGIFVTACLVLLAYLVVRVEDLRVLGDDGQRIDAVFDSVVGLDDKAPVRVAGVRVGRVSGIGLDEGNRARVTLLLDVPVSLTEGARARVTNAGILGDKYVELIPGPPGGRPLADGTVLPGDTPVSFDEALAKLNDLGDSVGELTGSFTEQDLASSISRLLDNLEATSSDIRQLVAANRDQVSATVTNFESFSGTLARELPELTQQIRDLLAQVDGVVAENREDLNASLGNIRDITERVQTSVDNLNSISSQIASGEGSLGKLVYDDEAHDTLVSTLDTIEGGVENLSETLGKIREIDLQLGVEGTYFTEVEQSRTAVSLDINPEKNRFYHVAVVDDPRGRRRSKTDVITTTLPDGTVEVTTIDRRTTEDDFSLSAQFGFRFGDATLRAGLFESTGGGAVDYGLFDRRLQLSLEAFDFSRPDDLDPHLRFSSRWQLNPNVYLVGGFDDFLIEDQRSVFLGAGVRWSDEDLKYLLGSIPSF